MTENNVAKPSDAVASMSEAWKLIADLMGGTSAMRKAGKRHLPQWPQEDEVSYKDRLATATLFPAYSRTVSVLTGKPFSKEVSVGEDVPARIQGWLDDVDLEGRNLHTFAADLFSNALAYGFCGILVDVPVAGGTRTVADENKAGIRPYFVHIKHDAVLGWKSERRGGNMMLTQLRLLEKIEEPDGQFSTKAITQVRVLEPSKWSTYRKQEDAAGADTWVLFQQGTTSIDVIPFIPIYGFRKEFMIGVPPLLELAYMNVEHWQSKSDQQTILHVARVPILFARNIGTTTPISVGSGALISASAETADLKYVEHSGKAIEAGRDSILDLEDRMRQVGAELLVIKSANTTEVQTIADNEQAMCDLQRMSQMLEDALDQALALMAKWVGEATGGHVSVYNDFGAASLSQASAKLLFEMQAAGSLSLQTLLVEMQRRGILSPDIDVDEELIAAKAEAKELERKENINV